MRVNKGRGTSEPTGRIGARGRRIGTPAAGPVLSGVVDRKADAAVEHAGVYQQAVVIFTARATLAKRDLIGSILGGGSPKSA